MNIDEISRDLEKLKYQIRILGESINYQTHPVEALIFSMNWGESDLDRAHDIFEKYDKKLEASESVNWHEFEHELRDEFSIGYQTVKQIILAFYNNHQWTNVCYGYAKSFEPTTPVEFHKITRENIK
ncbi:hypothetical protein [Yersinia pseudotuberculosis]|uniref:hypothetical protein n=1 Tax=Yersinia pseudotuberculosis TaxID=633 RepID=UPI0004F5D7BF|nr:hypothetical protein [Yersinia pseudotuberculosis]AIN14818.1 hypothetical protein DJ40_1115 [Yersinia pseudotuberculosis]SUP90543.1 Uncharacterised protein [Yersinia pseudotuberculosis]